MNSATLYIPSRENADIMSLDLNATFSHVRRRGLTLLGGSRGRLYGALTLGDVKLYSISSGNISVVPEHSDDLLVDPAGNEEGGVRLVFLCVIIDRQSVQPSPADWENRFQIMGYCVHVHCLRTGASRIVRVAVEDRLSDLYSRVRQLFVAVYQHGNILLTSALCDVPIVIDARPLVRDELPNGTNLYVRENPLSLPRDMRYTEIRFPPMSRGDLTSLSARTANFRAADAVIDENESPVGAMQRHSISLTPNRNLTLESPSPAENQSVRVPPNRVGEQQNPRSFLRNGADDQGIDNDSSEDSSEDSIDSSEDDDKSDDTATFQERGEGAKRRCGGSKSIDSKRSGQLPVRRSRRLQIHISDESEEESSAHCDTTFLEDACCNCKRTLPIGLAKESSENLPYKIGISFVNLRDLRTRRVFRSINPALYETGADGRQLAPICGQCYLHLMARDPDDEDGKKILTAAVWPHFVWQQLEQEQSYRSAWRLLPEPWRCWWIRSLCFTHGCREDELIDIPIAFNEVSVELEKDLQALKSLVWHRDILPREESLVKAEVKCPAGCCEFKHKAKELPMDIVWQWCLDRELKLYSNKKQATCMNWFRDDYLHSERLLWNDKWLCMPTITYCHDTETPVVLTCRFHTIDKKGYMLHPCRNPTGSVSTHKASQFTPVTPIPRTLRKAQFSAYGLSFHIAKMQGSFQGLDTMFLSSNGGYPFYQSKLAWKQECMAYHCRTDMKTYVSSLLSKKPHLSTIQPALERDNPYETDDWKEQKSGFLLGGNYMTMEDSVSLQQDIFYAQKETTRKPIHDGAAETEMVHFYGAWPRHLYHVHPANSRHGARPFIPTYFVVGHRNNDCRAGWLLTSMLLSVPELWSAVSGSYKVLTGWEGWVLTHVTAKSLPHLFLKGKDSPFRQMKQVDLYTKFIRTSGSTLYRPTDIYCKFAPLASQIQNYKNIHRSWDDFPGVNSLSDCVTIVIIVRKAASPRRSARVPRFLHSEKKDWELRYIALSERAAAGLQLHCWKGSYYMRHGGTLNTCWWRVGKGCTFPMKMGEDWTINSLGENLKHWTVCVYVKRCKAQTDLLRQQVLGACGGQSKALCQEHNFPLICSVPEKDFVCCYKGETICKATCHYTCPSEDCVVSLCKFHLRYLDVVSSPTHLQAVDKAKYKRIVSRRRRKGTSGTTSDDSRAGARNQTFDSPRTGIPLFEETDYSTEDLHQEHNNDTLLDDTFVLDPGVGMDDIPYVEGDADADMFDVDLCKNDIPTTNASMEPCFSDISGHDQNVSTITNHALLNCYGSCLIRRNRKLTGTIAQRGFLQRLVASHKGDTIPLIYPEAMLFSDIFYADNGNGAIIGALPAALLHGDMVLRQNGMASLQDTYRTRLMSPGLLTSTNPKYHFWAFDALANFSMRGCDSRVILRRGFAELQDNGGVRFRGVKEPIFDSEHVESRSLVSRISASIGERFPTYFYTHTCSMRTHFGMRLLWKWLMSDDLVEKECPEVTSSEIHDWRTSIIDGAGTYLLRVWMELIEIWLLYLTKSPDIPAGVIDAYVARMEFQGSYDDALKIISKGNLPHLHSLLTTRDNLQTEKGLMAALQRIRGSVDDIIQPSEEQSYFEKGIFSNKQEMEDFRSTMQRFLDHKHHRRCFVLQKDPLTGNHELRKVCKVANNWVLTDESGLHTFVDMPVNHTQEAIRVMIKIGVAQDTATTFTDDEVLEFIPLVDFLSARKHVPPSMGKDGIMSPVLGVLVAINPNSDNCQLANGYFVARYLAKYVIKIDEYHVIKIQPPSNHPADRTSFPVSSNMLHNTKITTNRIAQKQDLDRGYSVKQRNALGINVCDVYMKIFNYPTVYTNLRHVRYSTDTYENRAATMRRLKPIDRIINQLNLQSHALTAVETVPAHHARCHNNQTPQWRHFTPSQVRKAFDDLYSPLSMDPVTLFGLRPPELRFVMHQKYYHRWFLCEPLVHRYYDSNKKKVVSKRLVSFPEQIQFCILHFRARLPLYNTIWVSAATRSIRVRYAALSEIQAYLAEAPLEVFSDDAGVANNAKQATVRMFRVLEEAANYVHRGNNPLIGPVSQQQISLFRRLALEFVCEGKETFLPTPWTASVRPTQSTRFLLHLLLGYGAFVDEYSLFQTGSLRHAFIAARLLDETDQIGSANKLMYKYFVSELKTLPAGTPTFDRYTCLAYYTIHDFFTSSTLYTDEIPSVLYCRLAQQTTEKCASFSDNRKKQLVTTLHNKLEAAGINPLPSVDSLLTATIPNPLHWDISNLTKPAGQPVQSYEEQSAILLRAQNQIHAYLSPANSCPQSLCFVGGGGVGKTTSAIITVLYARSQGLTINATALVSERAQELGVPHLNSDFGIPKVDLSRTTPGQIAERTISSLYKTPEKLEFHRTVDVELVDEMGPIAAEIWSARDIALRYIRNSCKPNGGKLDIVTFDHLQSYPIQGTHPLLSPFITTTYRFFRLHESVRAANSAPWRRIQAITRLPPDRLASPVTEQEFVNLLTTHCRFVPTENLAPSSALFVYGRNAPVRLLQARLQRRKANTPGVVISRSDDQECNFEGRYVRAKPTTTKSLDRKVREHSELLLFQGGKYRVTFNRPGVHSNGQLAFMFQHPVRADIEHKRPIELLLAPPGCSYIPGDTDSFATLTARQWKVVKIGLAPENIIYIRNTKAKRSNQYGLQLYVGSTWHSTMGRTLAKLATQVASKREYGGIYSIWDPAQVVIMLSRTSLPEDTTFVSKDPVETAIFIYSVLKKVSPFRDYLSYLLTSLCENVQAGIPPQISSVDQSYSVYRPRDVTIPSDSTGFVYLLVSTVDLKFLYIGSCYNLIARYSSHNSGFGSLQTAPSSLRPWAILAYVSGFEGQKRNFLDFERRWIARRIAGQRQPNSQISVQAIVELGETIALEFNEDRHLNLRFVHSGTMTTLREHVPGIQVYSSTESEQDQSSESEPSESHNDAELDFASSDSDRQYDPSESSDVYEDYSNEDDKSDSSVEGSCDEDDDSDYDNLS